MRDILAVGQAGPDAHQLSVREAEEMMARSVLVTNESERGAYPGTGMVRGVGGVQRGDCVHGLAGQRHRPAGGCAGPAAGHSREDTGATSRAYQGTAFPL
jgi:hypothetical protein